MSDLCTKMVAQRFTTDEEIHFSTNIPGNGVDSNEENMFREVGVVVVVVVRLTHPMSTAATVTIQKKALRM